MIKKTFQTTVKLADGSYHLVKLQADGIQAAKIAFEEEYGSGSVTTPPVEVR